MPNEAVYFSLAEGTIMSQGLFFKVRILRIFFSFIAEALKLINLNRFYQIQALIEKKLQKQEFGDLDCNLNYKLFHFVFLKSKENYVSL